MGDWQASITALQRSVELQKDGGDPWQWFWLAMAHWQLGHQEEANRWFDQSVEWMDDNNNTREDVIRFRAEAAELLRIDLDESRQKQ